MIPVIDREKCSGCGTCEEVCPPRAITLKGDKAFINKKLCEECGECAESCPEEAITIPGK
ncbi:MAG: 4Fe-4S binding protein [Planctomycetota bacterium]|nr:4Fe-4S binding protein [Planctomycetota bacterium]